MDDYDKRCKAIDERNKLLLDGFASSLLDSGLSPKTIRSHVENIDFFATFLVSNEEPIKRLDEADETDIRMFLSFWFHRKAMWSSVESTKSNMISLKKFYKWMGETMTMSDDVVEDIITTLKERRADFLAAAQRKETSGDANDDAYEKRETPAMTDNNEPILGYSGFDIFEECYGYNENACYIADDEASVERFMGGAADSGHFRVEPVTLSRIMNDYGVSAGDFAMERQAFARFREAAREAGVEFEAHPLEFDTEVTVVNVEGVKSHDDRGTG